MPQLIQTIDRIARIQQRDVLFLSFYDRALKERLDNVPKEERFDAQQQWRDHRSEAWATLPIRQQIIDWLDAKGIAWQPCAQFAPGWVIMEGYVGDIYLDVPYDKDLPLYQELEAYFDHFLRCEAGDNIKAECLLPGMVGDLLEQGQLEVSVLHSADRWFGMTYHEDRQAVAAELQKLHAGGVYPPTLRA